MTSAELAAEGLLALPAFAEPHAHLDKAFLAETVPNPTGDLLGAIVAMDAARSGITVTDTVRRAERAVMLMVRNGTTAIRTHADVTVPGGLVSMEALVEVRRLVAAIADVQVVALTGFPSLGPAGAEVRALLAEAIAVGADAVGGCPHLEADVGAANEQFMEIAAAAGLPLDLHVDETLDPAMDGLADLARRVIDSGFDQQVVAGHCVSLGCREPDRQREVADLVAAAGIAVIALPQTNLYLQGHGRPVATPRGLTALGALLAARVTVAAGGDNLQDPFNPLGRGDPLDTAALLVTGAHLAVDDALDTVGPAARAAIGLPAGDDLVGIPVGNAREALAFAPGGRTVIRRGQVIVRDGQFV